MTVHLTELDVLLEFLGKSGATFHAFGVDHDGPDLFAAVVRWDGAIADVLIIFDECRAVAYRTTTGQGLDVFAPRHAYWIYGGSPVWTLRALLTLAPPGHVEAPGVLMDAPPGFGIPIEGRMPVSVRRRGR